MTDSTPQPHGHAHRTDLKGTPPPIRITVEDGGSMDDKGTLYVDLLETLSKVVHSINNPLAIISGHAQLLLELSESEAFDPEVIRYLQNIEEASQRLAVELGQLRDVRTEVGPYDISGDGV